MKKTKRKYIVVGVYNDSDGFLPLVARMNDTVYSDRQSARRGAYRIAVDLLKFYNESEGKLLTMEEAWETVDDRRCTGDYGFDPIGNEVSFRRIRIMEVAP